MENESIIDVEPQEIKTDITHNVLEQNDIVYKLPDPPDQIINNYYVKQEIPENIYPYYNSADNKNKQKALLIGGAVITLVGVALILGSLLDNKDNNANKLC